MLRFAVIVALAIAAPAFSPVLAADPATKQASAPVAPTATFVAQAAFGNMFEIESSKLALDRSKTGPVKDFAQRMVDDHSAAAVKFKEAVLEAKLAMPPDKLDAKHRAIVDQLAGKQGGDFDQAYIEAQYKAHVETVEPVQGLRPGRRGYADARVRGRAAAHPAGASRPRRQDALRVSQRSGPPSLATGAARSPAPGCCRRSGCC